MITILAPNADIVRIYSLYPILISKHYREFTVSSSESFVLSNKDTNRHIVLLRYLQSQYPGNGNGIEFLQRLRQHYDTVAVFEDNAGAECHHLDVLPHVDLYFTRSLYRDRRLYAKEFHGERMYADYYHHRFGATDSQAGNFGTLASEKDLSKLRLAWNVGLGLYDRTTLKRRIAKRLVDVLGFRSLRLLYKYASTPFSGEPLGEYCNARFSHGGFSESVGYQRKLLLETIDGHPAFRTEKVPQKEYLSDLRNAGAVLSPFGWGEICIRDFEAIRSGSVLVKPNMDHVETWPDIYQKNETYLDIDWDGADLLDTVTEVLANLPLRRNLTQRAAALYRQDPTAVDVRVEAFANEIIGRT